MNNIKVFIGIYYGKPNRDTHELTDIGVQQMEQDVTILKAYRRYSKTEKMLLFHSDHPDVIPSAKFLQKHLDIECIASPLFRDTANPNGYKEALSFLKKEAEKRQATTVIVVSPQQFAEEFPQYVVRDKDNDFPKQAAYVKDLNFIRGAILMLYLETGLTDFHFENLPY